MAYTPAELVRRQARKLLQNPQTRPTLPRLGLTTLEDRVVPAVTGLVYQDYNSNGTFDTGIVQPNSGAGTYRTAGDQGVGGLTVTAFDAAGNSVGSATVGPDGRYTLNTPAGGPYRVEFSNLPAGLFYGPQGTTADTAVQFVTSGDAANVNLAVVRPQDYSTDNPLIFTTQFHYAGSTPGAATSPNAAEPAILAFPYSAGATDPGSTSDQYRDPADKPLTVAHSEVGSTWGLGYDRLGSRVFASSYTKRHSGYGPNGPGAIYTVNLPTQSSGGVPTPNAEAEPWLVLPADEVGGGAGSLNALRAGYDDVEDYNRDSDNVGWDAVGKSSFGGLDV